MKKTKDQPFYIVVLGGVLSSVGKGIVAASIGNCLKARDLDISIQKFDMYLNVDAGTLKPGKHGEVYVTVDGGEADLDLGHYERFLDIELSKHSSIMQGAVLQEIIRKERSGHFKGDDVQIIPHLTNLIQDKMESSAQGRQVHIIELGGTIGDYEGLAFIEAVRQLEKRVGQDNILYVYVVYLPYLETSGELKTKPAQNAVRDLQAIGIQPDVIVGRCQVKRQEKSTRHKLSLFSQVSLDNIVLLEDLSTVYEVPMVLEKTGLIKTITRKLDCSKKPDFKRWRQFVTKAKREYPKVAKVAMIAKYLDNKDTYISLVEGMKAATWSQNLQLDLQIIDAEALEKMTMSEVSLALMRYHGVLVPGGFGERGVKGMIKAATYAIQNNAPYLGICLGMHVATIAFARLHGLSRANSKEFDKHGDQLVITHLPGQADKYMTGGTMRLGSYPCQIKPGSLAHEIFTTDSIQERHRHRFEFNPDYQDYLEKEGLVISGTCPSNGLAEIIELPKTEHSFFIACQFHPEFSSRPIRPHPLFVSFVKNIKKLVK